MIPLQAQIESKIFRHNIAVQNLIMGTQASKLFCQQLMIKTDPYLQFLDHIGYKALAKSIFILATFTQ